MPQATPDIRLATPADAAAIRALVRAAYARWVPVIGREPLPMLADYDVAVLQHRIDLLWLGDELVGLIETELREDHLWIENVAVSPTHQGKGYGRLLLAQAELLAHAAGLGETRLLTNAAFATNVELYTRVGYGETAREPFMGGATVNMTKRLAP